ncbi:membrane protein [Pseudorhizobium endolithicum]|uniref:Membrane protein n=1 Tax=Pseudorhizobium endolithicum TaxID=1191678 RepID=A0ABM8PXC5_9HYPH|nr:MAPEG family protein [Pseudorhizobium endolithicum]CAD6423561.1 membrane protein [Rhizobium sp. Q54]CAD7053578.1 membrane protein [Pseudorhizobium endolithicum]
MTFSDAMLWPMMAHAALVFGLYFLLSSKRMTAVRAGRVKAEQFKENREEPLESLLIHNNLKNQFELPVLFHAVCLSLYVTTADNMVTVLLAWAFVVSRYVHSYVHITTNRLRHRRPVWIAGYFILLALWVWLALWLVLN